MTPTLESKPTTTYETTVTNVWRSSVKTTIITTTIVLRSDSRLARTQAEVRLFPIRVSSIIGH